MTARPPSAAATPHRPPPASREDGIRVVVAALGVAISGVLPTFLVGALAVQIRAEFALSPTALGLATTSFFLASSVGSFVVGHRIDRMGWQRTMAVASVVQVAILVGIAVFAHGVPTLLAFLFVAGLVHAAAMPAGNLAIVRSVPVRRQALVFGIRQSAIPGAVLLAGLAVPAIGLTIGWRWAFVVVLLGPTATLWTLLTSRDGRRGWDAGVRGATGPSVRSRGLVAIVLASMLGAMVVNTSGAFFVSSAVDRGTAEALAGVLLAVGSVTAIAMRVLAGNGVDRRGSTGFVPMAALLAVGAVGLALLATGHPALLVVGTPLAFGAGTGWAGLMHYILVTQHPDNPASASAAVLAFGYAGGALGPVGFGLVVDTLGYGVAWGASATAAAGAAALTLVSRRLFAQAAGR